MKLYYSRVKDGYLSGIWAEVDHDLDFDDIDQVKEYLMDGHDRPLVFIIHRLSGFLKVFDKNANEDNYEIFALKDE